jgi:hypothetical protein
MDQNLLQVILDNQNKMSEDIGDIKVIIAKQEQNIEYHVKRTDLAEENIALFREEMKPVKAHVATIHTILKIIGGLGVLLSIAASIVKILAYFT